MIDQSAGALDGRNIPTVSLGDVATRVTKGTTPTSIGAEYTDHGVVFVRVENLVEGLISRVSCLRISKTTHENLSRSKLVHGDVLFSIAGTIGKTALVDQRALPANINQAIALIRLPVSLFEPAYVFWYLSAFGREMTEKRSRGGAMSNISLGDVRQFRIPVHGLKTQRQIVELVRQLLSRITAAEKELDRAELLLTRLRQSLLTRAFDGSLTASWRKNNRTESADDLLARISEERENHYRKQLTEWESCVAEWERNGKQGKRPAKPRTPKDVEPLTEEELGTLPTLPETWRWVRLEELALVGGGITKNSRQKKSGVTSEVPYLRVANVQEGMIDLSEVTTIGASEGEIGRYHLEKSDLLFVEGNGSIEQIGRVATWSGQIVPCIHQNHLIRARFWDSAIPQYAEQWFHAPDGKSAIRSKASSTSGLYTLSISKIESLVVPLPPTTEQHEIVSILSRHTTVIRRRQEEIAVSRDKLKALRRSILQAAFSGLLTAKWRAEHPELISGENSAEALLARITEEHSS